MNELTHRRQVWRTAQALTTACAVSQRPPTIPAQAVPVRRRPEAVSLASGTADESGPLAGTVIAVTFLGATSRVTVNLGDTTVMAQLATADATELSAGSRVALTIRPDPVLVSVAQNKDSVAASGA